MQAPVLENVGVCTDDDDDGRLWRVISVGAERIRVADIRDTTIFRAVDSSDFWPLLDRMP